MKIPKSEFTVAIPVKPYVFRFLEINYGNPVNLFNQEDLYQQFKCLLSHPDYRYDHRYPLNIRGYTKLIEIYICEEDFYSYGWELTKTNIIKFQKKFEARTKAFMRTTIGLYIALGIPQLNAIKKFQDDFNFSDDWWSYEAIKKDYYRHTPIHEKIDFDNEIFKKIKTIILRNLSVQGTLSQNAIENYENIRKTK